MIHAFGLEAPGVWASRRPLLGAAFLVAVLALSLWALPNVRFDDNVERAFTSRGDSSEAYAALLDELGGVPADILVLAEAETRLTPEHLAEMRMLVLEMQFLEGVSSILSPFTARFSRTDPDFPGAPVLPQSVTEEAIEERIELFRSRGPGVGPMVGEDLRRAVMIVSVTRSEREDGLRGALDEVRALTRQFEAPGLTYTVTGGPAIAVEIVDNLRRELLTSNLAGGAIAFILSLAIFGSVRAALAVTVPAGLAALASLSLFAVFGFPITVLSNIVPILVLVLGLADSIHLFMHYRQQDGAEPAAARVLRTVREVGPACALTAVTTAVGFAAVGASDNPQLDELALLGGGGVMLAYLIVLVAFTVLAPLAGAVKVGRQPGAWLKIPGFVADWAIGRDRLAIGIAVALTVAGGLALARTEAWFPLYQNLPDGSDVRHAHRAVEESFGGYFRVWAELELEDGEGIATPEGWARLVALTEAIEDAAPRYSVISLATISRWLGTPDAAPDAGTLGVLPPTLEAELLSEDGGVARVIVLAPEPMRDREALETQDRIEAAARAAGAAQVVGFPIVIRHEAIVLIEQLAMGLVAACFVSVAVIALFFRWPALAPALLLPNTLPLFVSGAALHLINAGQVNVTSVLALTIAYGIAVDDSIHFANRYRMERAKGQDVDAALRASIGGIGRVMAATTLLISTGLVVTLFSAFETVRQFGVMLILTFVIALVADLLVLPAILRQPWFRRG